MPFAYPWILMLLVIPVKLAIWTWKRNGHQVVVPFDHGIARRGTGLRVLLNFASTLPALLLAVAIIIFAGPQQISEPRNKKVMTNIQFCLDVSGSMNSPFGEEGNRYDGAMKSLNEFITYRSGDAFGLTIFGDHFLHWIRLTTDPSAFKYATPFLGPRRLPPWFSGGTKIGRALDQCLDLLVEREEGDRMIILISDGYSSDLSGGRDEEIARKLADNDIAVYAIHVAPGSPPPEIGVITNITGGEIFAAGDPLALDTIFKRIDDMQETKLEKVSMESMDYFKPFAIAGLSIGGLHLLFLVLGIRYTPW